MPRTLPKSQTWTTPREGYLPLPKSGGRSKSLVPSVKNIFSSSGSRLSMRRAFIGMSCLGAVYVICLLNPYRDWIYPAFFPGSALTCLRSDSDEDGLTPGELFQFLDLNTPSNNYYIPYRDANTSPASHQPPYQLDAKANCLDDHIALGAICPDVAESHRLDLVWAYVNGSDPLHEKAYRSVWADEKKQNPKIYYPAPKVGSFREFDELRYSIRSVATNFRHAARKLFVLTSSFPLPGCDTSSELSTTWRLGQIPSWLKRRSDLVQEKWKDRSLELNLLHHHDVFEPLHNLSIFNSLAIESRLHVIEGLSNNFIYMNDDVFFHHNLSYYDFYTNEYGPVFRMQPDLLVTGAGVTHGEWVALQRSNQLLDARFGNRSRPYVAHIAKTLSKPLLYEIADMWKEEFAVTASHPFRSLNRFVPDFSTTLSMTHYTVERWREALLWSFIVASIGGDADEWGYEHMRRALRALGGTVDDEIIFVQRGTRETLRQINNQLFGDGRRPMTSYVYSSFDGYPYAGLGRRGWKIWPSFTPPAANATEIKHPAYSCEINVSKCFTLPEDSLKTASEMFKHVAFRMPDCGDCIVDALVDMSGVLGLDAFLPDSKRIFTPKSRPFFGAKDTVPVLPITPRWEDADFSLRAIPFTDMTVRQWVLQALHRYRFVIGSTPATFVQLETLGTTNRHLKAIDAAKGTAKDPAIICLNDDVYRNAEKYVRPVLKSWLDSQWPETPEWEAS